MTTLLDGLKTRLMSLISTLKRKFYSSRENSPSLETQKIIIQPYQTRFFKEVVYLIASEGFNFNGEELPRSSYVALYNDSVVGYIGSDILHGHVAFVSLLVVSPPARQLGVATALMKQMLLEYKNTGVVSFSATCDKDAKVALDIYKKIGISLREVYLLEANVKDIHL